MGGTNVFKEETKTSLEGKRPGYYFILLRNEKRKEQQSREEADTRLKERAFDQLRNRFHDKTQENLFRVIQAPGLVELTSMDGKRGYFFCGNDSRSACDPETRLSQYIAKQERIGERSILLKVVDYQERIAGFSWSSA